MDFKAYVFKDHFKPGLKFYGAYSLATYNTKVSYTTDDTTLSGQTASSAVTVVTYKVGAEYIFKIWGIRFDYGLSHGQNIDTDNYPDHMTIFDYKGSNYSLGTYFFF